MKKTVFLIITSAVIISAIFAVGYTVIDSVGYTSGLRVVSSEGIEYVTYTGTVEYAGSEAAAAEGSGIVRAVLARNGDIVKKGDAVMTVAETSAQFNISDLISSGGASDILSGGTVKIYYAKSSGVLGGLDLDAGGVFTKGQTLFSVSEPGEYQVSLNVSESDIKKIKKGQDVQITCPAVYGQMHGFVESIGKTASQTGKAVTVKVTVSVSDPPSDLRTGCTAECSVTADKKSGIYLLPYSAVGGDAEGAYVYISKGNHLERRPVKLGKEFSNGVEITEGLSDGDIAAADVMTVKDPSHTVVNEVITDVR